MSKAIFTEGIAISTNADGSYRVEDIATGLPIGCVRGFEVDSGLENLGHIIVTLDIETVGMRCTLVFEDSVQVETPGGQG